VLASGTFTFSPQLVKLPNVVFSCSHFFCRVGADSNIKYLVLQVHYASVANIPQEGDDSGVFLQYTDEEQPKV
jgi:hypothetical protein